MEKFHHEGTKGIKDTMKGLSVQNTTDAVLQNLYIEINQEAQPEILEAQVGEKLGSVYCYQFLHCFHFNYHVSLYDQVQLDVAVKHLTLVADRED